MTIKSGRGLVINLSRRINLVVQGITGKQGRFFLQKARRFGMTKIMGVTPGHGGETVSGIPVFDTVEEAARRAGLKPEASLILVPADHAKDAVMEAVSNDIRLIVCVTEGVPVQDTCFLRSYIASRGGAVLVGPNTPGLIAPGLCNVSIQPDFYHSGEMAVISRSGSLSYETVTRLWSVGIGASLIMGIGGDPVTGLTFVEALELVRDNEETKGVALVGEIGSRLEQQAADYILRTRYPKPVMLYIAGVHAPAGRRMGHAGALISGREETAAAKLAYWQERDLATCSNLVEIGTIIRELLIRRA